MRYAGRIPEGSRSPEYQPPPHSRRRAYPWPRCKLWRPEDVSNSVEPHPRSDHPFPGHDDELAPPTLDAVIHDSPTVGHTVDGVLTGSWRDLSFALHLSSDVASSIATPNRTHISLLSHIWRACLHGQRGLPTSHFQHTPLTVFQNKDTVSSMETYDLNAMFAFTLTMGFTAFLMAWVIMVLGIKGWAVRRETNARKNTRF